MGGRDLESYEKGKYVWVKKNRSYSKVKTLKRIVSNGNIENYTETRISDPGRIQNGVRIQRS